MLRRTLSVLTSLLILQYAHVASATEDSISLTFLGTGAPRPSLDRYGPSILVEAGSQRLLVDAGPGMRERLFQAGGFELLTDINLILLTHLHFDHCGGAIEFDSTKNAFRPAFKNATFWSNKDHWQWATQPNPREKASFLKENILPIEESGQLKWISVNGNRTSNAFPGIDIFFADGHTDKQMIPIIDSKGKKIAFMADLLPSTGHIPLPYVMGYDTRPLLTMTEKESFLKEAADNDYVLFLEHDSINECCNVIHTEKGVRLGEIFPLASL